ncbi:hypothetical protein G6026_06905, partial [Dietzia sp. DQ11-38-2]|nr:hypothetical protein [Dietzia sp. DQ11-38-2]
MYSDLTSELDSILGDLAPGRATRARDVERVHPTHRRGAENLVDYASLRR